MQSGNGQPIEYAAQPPYGEAPYVQPGFPPAVKRPNRTIIRLAVFVIIVIAALIIVQVFVFRLKTVYVIGNTNLNADYIVSLSGLVQGDNIFAVNEDDVRDSLETDHRIILNHFYKQYPNEIFLFVDEREIVAVMQWLGIEYTLDINGMVMEEYSDMNFGGKVPTILGFKVSDAIVGEFLSVRSNTQLVAFSAIISELLIQRYAENVVSINLSDADSLSLLTEDGITVQLGNSDYMRAKIGAMRTYIAYLQQTGEPSGVLDVTVPEDGKFRRE